MLKKLNLPAVGALIFYPIFLIILGTNYCINHTLGSFELMLFIVGYYGSNISVGVGLHRLWSHNAFKTNKIIEFILAMMTAGTLQGPALAWVSDHHKHHTYTDKDQDPHSPNKFKNKVLGFLWSHIGWMLLGEARFKHIDRITMVKLGKNPILRWQLKHYWKIAVFMNTIFPAFVGYLLSGFNIQGAYIGFLFIGLGRALQQQATFCVNSVCHFVGTAKYYKGTARDIWWLAPFLLGENWHNFHHAFASDYRNGAKWYHLDAHKWIIYVMSKVGLAWDLDRTPEVRIEAKMRETARYFAVAREEKLASLKDKANQLIEDLRGKFASLEDSGSALKVQILKSFTETQESLKKLTEQLQTSIDLSEKSRERLIKIASAKLVETEKMVRRLCQQIDFAAS